jgi:hypothetical protein
MISSSTKQNFTTAKNTKDIQSQSKGMIFLLLVDTSRQESVTAYGFCLDNFALNTHTTTNM